MWGFERVSEDWRERLLASDAGGGLVVYLCPH
jgi:hypothetical protein